MANSSSISLELSQNIHADQLKLLYLQSFPAVFYSLITAVLFSAILWNEVSQGSLVSWMLAILATSLIRLLLFLSYQKQMPDHNEILRWEQPYFITLMISSFVWGTGALLLIYETPLYHQAVTYFFLIGMAGGALSVYAAIRYFAISSIAMVLMPITIWFFFQAQFSTVMMATACVFFLIAANRSTKVLSDTLQQTFTLTHELNKAREQAEYLARTDELTRMNNRRAFMEFASQQLMYCNRHQHTVSMLMLDIDEFKSINDQFGHAAGDAALQHLSRVIRHNTRRSDISARLGGEEFGILLLNIQPQETLDVAYKLLSAVSAVPVKSENYEFNITVSIGIADTGYDLSTLLSQSDHAMYHSKHSGRNTVSRYSDLQASDQMELIPA